MNPTVAAAFIGVGGSVLVAVTSFLTTRVIMARQLADAHQGRIWDRQAATYTDAIAGVQWRTTRRNRDISALKRYGLPSVTSDPADNPVDWVELQGRLFAFATPEVLVALKKAGDAGSEVDTCVIELYALITMAHPPGEEWNRATDSTGEIERAIESADHAAQVANDMDDALIDAIRADLHGESGRALGKLSHVDLS